MVPIQINSLRRTKQTSPIPPPSSNFLHTTHVMETTIDTIYNTIHVHWSSIYAHIFIHTTNQHKRQQKNKTLPNHTISTHTHITHSHTTHISTYNPSLLSVLTSLFISASHTVSPPRSPPQHQNHYSPFDHCNFQSSIDPNQTCLFIDNCDTTPISL